jgi:hypothetical protein
MKAKTMANVIEAFIAGQLAYTANLLSTPLPGVLSGATLTSYTTPVARKFMTSIGEGEAYKSLRLFFFVNKTHSNTTARQMAAARRAVDSLKLLGHFVLYVVDVDTLPETVEEALVLIDKLAAQPRASWGVSR